jgi:hypothetical protein
VVPEIRKQEDMRCKRKENRRMCIARSKEIEECSIQEARNQEDVARKQKDMQCQEQGNRRKCDTRVKETEEGQSSTWWKNLYPSLHDAKSKETEEQAIQEVPIQIHSWSARCIDNLHDTLGSSSFEALQHWCLTVYICPDWFVRALMTKLFTKKSSFEAFGALTTTFFCHSWLHTYGAKKNL